VPSGSFLRAWLLPGNEQVTLSLSGIQCPPIKRGEDGAEEAAPFAREAKFFVESRLLHRDVQLVLQVRYDCDIHILYKYINMHRPGTCIHK